MRASSTSVPLISRRVHVLTSSALVALLVVLGVVFTHQGAVGASTPKLTNIRVTAGGSRVGNNGHVWHSDRRVARGGHVTRTTDKRHVPRRFRFARVGRFTYRLRTAPGVYAVSVDVVASKAHPDSVRSIDSTSATTHARSRRLIDRVAGRRIYQVTWRTRVISGVLTLHFAAHSEVTNTSVLGIHHLRVRRPAPKHPTAPSTGSTSGSGTGSGSGSGTPTPPPGTSVPTGDITPEQFGATGNGVTDDTTALQTTFDDADGRTVYLPAGQVYAHDAVLYLRVAGLHVTGPGELLATNQQDSSVWIEADNVTVDGGVDIKTQSTTQRWDAWEQMGVRLMAFSGDTLTDVTVDGSAAAGVYVGGANDFLLDHVTVQNTRADGITMTDGAYDGRVVSPLVRSSGDDGVSIVSYKQDGVICHDITVTSPTVLTTTWGRGLSVVGGNNITETNIDVQKSSAAAVYIAAEGSPWYTAAPTNVSVTGGQVIDANTDTTVDHGAVVVLSAETDVVPSGVTVSHLRITNTRATASRDIGVIQYGAAPSSVLFSDLVITGGPASAYEGNTAQSSYALRNIVQNGVLLANAG